MAAPNETQKSLVEGLAGLPANSRFVFTLVTTATHRRSSFVEWPVGTTLTRLPGGGLDALPKSAALTSPAAAAVTNNIGGSILSTLPAIVGAVYATDSGAIKNALSTLTAAHNATVARLEDLIAKLKAAGIQT